MKTLVSDVNNDRARIYDDLVASSSVVEMRYQDGKKALSLRAGKMLHILVKAANGNLNQHIKHRIPLSSFRDIAHFKAEELEQIAGELISARIKFRCGDDVSQGPILDFAKNNVDGVTGDLSYRFSETMVSVFSADDRWTILSRKMVMAFKSRYALRLFEMLSIRQGFGRHTEAFMLDDLRARLGVEKGKLKSFDHFRSKCIAPAIEEVQRVMDMTITYDRMKTGRAVTGILLTWCDPLSASNTGKKGSRQRKINPSVEQATSQLQSVNVSDGAKVAFPTSGGITYSKIWSDLSRTHAPGWDPDIIAASFRDSCLRSGIPLNDSTIDVAFVSFCQGYAKKRKTKTSS